MAKIQNIEYDESKVAPTWRYCFCSDCERHEECLRYQTGLHLPDDKLWGNAVFPTACKNGDCKYFKEIRAVRVAYGFNATFREVMNKDVTSLRKDVFALLGGRSTYYRHHRGEYKLLPEQQEAISALFAKYGYTENVIFDHYCDVLDFS